MRNLIEFQFTRTKRFYSRLLFVYFISMVMFMMQLHWITGPAVFILNTIQLFIQILFFFNELI